jgi:FMN reductase
MTRTVAVVSAGLSQPSSTRLLADRLTRAVQDNAFSSGMDIQPVHIELRELAHDITDNMLTGFPSTALRKAIEALEQADAIIAVTPVFSGSFSGLFKSFFDVLERDALDGKPMLIAATGGSARHSLVLEYALRPLMAYLRARVVPTGVFAATADFGSASAGASLAERIDRSAGELSALLAGAGPVKKADPFDLAVDFEQLLRR